MSKHYELILFDLDDTLLDFKAAEQTAFSALLSEFFIRDDGKLLAAYSVINQQVWAELEQKLITPNQVKVLRFQRLIELFSLNITPHEMSKVYLSKLSENSTEIPGALQLLSSLSGEYRLGLVTNGLSQVQNPRIQNSGLRPYFEHVFISEELGVSKPSAEFFSLVFEKFQNPDKNQTLIVGDSMSSDIKGGIEFGIDTCWFNPDNHLPKYNPTFSVTSLSSLLEHLNKS